jgi:hypothetical protein
MSSLLLQINLDLQAGSAINSLNIIESVVDKIINKLQQFSQHFSSNPINIVQPQQLDIATSLSSVIGSINKIGQSITNENIENLARSKNELEIFVDQARILEHQGNIVQGLAEAELKRISLAEQFDDFHEKSRKFHADHKKQIDLILKNKIDQVKFTRFELKEFKNYIKSLDIAVKLGGDHLAQLGMSASEAKKLRGAMEQVEFSGKRQISIWENVGKTILGFINIIPAAGVLVTTLTNPINAIKDSLSEIHNAWKKNNQVSNNFLVNAEDKAAGLGVTLIKTRNKISSAGGGMADGFKDLGIILGDNIVTLDQASQALDAVMSSSYKSIAKNNDELAMYSSIIAQSSRATGLSVNTTADLMLRTGELGVAASTATSKIEKQNDGIKAAAKLNAVLVNSTAKYGMSIDEVGHVAGILNKNMGLLKTTFKGNQTLLNAGIPVTSQYATMLTSLGKAAKDAGYDSKMAMDAFASAMESPMENIMLLGNAVTSTDPTQQMLAMGETAVQVAKEMEGKSLFEQQLIAGIYGKSVDQINAMSDAHKGLNAKYGDLSNQENLLKMNKDMADQASADAVMKAAQVDAANNLAAASDKLTIIFSQLATALQPVINAIAWLISLPFAPYVLIAAGAVTALWAAMKGWGVIKGLKDALGGIADSTKGLATKSGAGLKGFAEGIKNFINTLGQIDIKAAAKAAVSIALVGVGLAAAIVPIALAASLLPPDKLGQLVVVIGGIIGMSYLLSTMGPIGPTALMGAVMVAAVGGALAAGVALIGLAANLLPPDKLGALALVVGGLLAAMVVLSFIGPIGPLALWGAVMVAAVGAALAAGIALIALSSKLIDPDIGDKFKELSVGIGWLALTAVTGPLALIGAIAMAAAAPLLALSIVAIGTAASLFGESAIAAVTGLAASAASIPAGAGAALIGVAAGLAALAAALTGGAIFSFFSGGMVNNAKEMGEAMKVLLGPITELGNVGDQVGKSFVSIADGLKVFVEAINDSSGWFSSFEGKAEKVAAAMRKISEPMKDMRGGPSMGEIPAEEIKKSLAITIESTNKSNQEMIVELKEIKNLLVEKHDKDIGDKMDQSVIVLKKILNEMIMGGGFGSTSANTDYSA